MKLYVPEIGSKIKLTQAWDFCLYPEYRNTDFFTKLNLELTSVDYTYQLKNETLGAQAGFERVDVPHEHAYSTRQTRPTYKYTLPKDTVLKVERIYVRSGAADFSSLTFRILECSTKQLEKARFWAKLYDCNNIEFDLVDDTTKSHLVKETWVKDTVVDHKEFKKILAKRKYGHKFAFEFSDESGNMVHSVVDDVNRDWTFESRYNRSQGTSVLCNHVVVLEASKSVKKDNVTVRFVVGDYVHNKSKPPTVFKDLKCHDTKGNSYFLTVYTTKKIVQPIEGSA